jgi:hypothetical protein
MVAKDGDDGNPYGGVQLLDHHLGFLGQAIVGQISGDLTSPLKSLTSTHRVG